MMLASCTECGLVFEPKGLFGGHGGYVELVNCATVCPRCGGTANIQDGAYTIANDIVTAVRGLTPYRLQDIYSILALAKANKKKPESVLDDIAKIEPGLAVILQRAASGKIGIAFLLLFLFLILKQCSSGGPLLDIHVNQTWNETILQQQSMDSQNPGKQEEDNSRKSPSSDTNEKDRPSFGVGSNRHERRKASALARKEKPTHRWDKNIR